MHIRTFRAASMQEALAEIRQQMGPEAAVLHTRQTRGGFLGWAGKKQVEVTAGLRVELPSRITPPVAPVPANPPVAPVAPSRITEDLTGSIRTAPHTSPLAHAASHAEPAANEERPIEQRLAELSELVRSLQATSKNGSPASAIELMLSSHGLDDVTSRNLIQIAEKQHREPLPTTIDDAWPRIQQAAASLLRIGSPIRAGRGKRRVVALAGPTGVGKTTTIAKLAAGFRLQTGLQVGLLTIDTFRMGAIEQLRAYAEIMDLPMEVVQDGEQMGTALQKLEACDLVLIDTAGRSPRDRLHVRQLAELLSRARPDEVHLVLSATSSPATAERVIRGYAPVEPSGLILSKLDEVDGAGGLLPTLAHDAPPLTYMTVGQSVPDDIERADAQRLVARLLPAAS